MCLPVTWTTKNMNKQVAVINSVKKWLDFLPNLAHLTSTIAIIPPTIYRTRPDKIKLVYIEPEMLSMLNVRPNTINDVVKL